MREIAFGEIVLQEYDNEKIYRNFHVMEILCTIALVFSVFTAVVFTYIQFLNNAWTLEFSSHYFLFYFFLIMQPLTTRRSSINYAKRPSTLTANQISKFMRFRSDNNKKILTKFPFASIICGFLIDDILKLIMLILLCLIGASFGSWRFCGYLAYLFGYMVLPHIFIYIAAGFLVYNCILMKREWDIAPPKIVLESRMVVKKRKEEKMYIKNYSIYKKLIEQCGIKFFIKYYRQLKLLPLRDVNVTDNYTVTEKEERLNAAKKIIDLDLSEFALNEILKSYADILDESEVSAANAILAELNR